MTNLEKERFELLKNYVTKLYQSLDVVKESYSETSCMRNLMSLQKEISNVVSDHLNKMAIDEANSRIRRFENSLKDSPITKKVTNQSKTQPKKKEPGFTHTKISNAQEFQEFISKLLGGNDNFGFNIRFK